MGYSLAHFTADHFSSAVKWAMKSILTMIISVYCQDLLLFAMASLGYSLAHFTADQFSSAVKWANEVNFYNDHKCVLSGSTAVCNGFVGLFIGPFYS